MAKREVFHMDAKDYLKKVNSLPTVITSLPDPEEVKMEVDEWKVWFEDMATEIMRKVRPNSFAIFYQTDRKKDGGLISKSYLLDKACEKAGLRKVFHKIVLKNSIGGVNLYRPGYTHLVGYSKEAKAGKATPDVMLAGEMLYKNAMGFIACEAAIHYAKRTDDDTIIDPFCGKGSVLKIANENGFNAIGVDIDWHMCKASRE